MSYMMMFLFSFAAMVPLRWEEGAPMPLPRAGCQVAAVRGKLLVAGGSYWKDGQKYWSDRCDLYDPIAREWSAVERMPEPRSDGAAVAAGETVYVFGGTVAKSVAGDALEFRNGQWQRSAVGRLPEPRQYAAAVAHGSKIYLQGGTRSDADYRSAASSLWEFDTATPRHGWQKLADLPGPPRANHAMALWGGFLYVFGGTAAENDGIRNLSDAYRFDLKKRVWTRLPEMPVARRAWCAVAVDGRIYLPGGYTSRYETEVWVYDVTRQKWTPASPLPHPNADGRFVRLGNLMIGASGETADYVRAPWVVTAQLGSGRSREK